MATVAEIDQAASALRDQLDDVWETKADLFGERVANADTKLLYSYITLLHHYAKKGI